MLPRWHIFWGAVFAAIVWLFAPDLNPIYLILILFGAIFIDFDHYIAHVNKNKNLSLKKALKYYDEHIKMMDKKKEKGIRERGDFHIFHTVEFHILVAILGLIWIGFFYVFIGMVFHSLLDLAHKDVFYAREYFLFNWLRKNFL